MYIYEAGMVVWSGYLNNLVEKLLSLKVFESKPACQAVNEFPLSSMIYSLHWESVVLKSLIGRKYLLFCLSFLFNFDFGFLE